MSSRGQHPQVDPERGGRPLTPVLQAEANTQQGPPEALAHEPDMSPSLCHLNTDGHIYKVQSSSLLGMLRSQLLT